MLALPILLAFVFSSGIAAYTDADLINGHPNLESSRTIVALLRRRLSSEVCCDDWAQACCVSCILGYSYDFWCQNSPNFLGCPGNPNSPGMGPDCSERPTAFPTRLPTVVPTPSPTSCEHRGDTLFTINDLANTTKHTLNEVFDLSVNTDLQLQTKVLSNLPETEDVNLIASIDADVTTAATSVANLTSDSAIAKSDFEAMKTDIAAMKASIASIKTYMSSTVTLLASVKSMAQQYYDENLYNPFASSTILGDKAELGIWLYDKLPKKSMSLCWRGTAHGFGSSTFHTKCDRRGSSVTIIEDTFGGIFGGYGDGSWHTSGWISNYRSFLYQLVGPNNDGSEEWPALVPVK